MLNNGTKQARSSVENSTISWGPAWFMLEGQFTAGGNIISWTMLLTFRPPAEQDVSFAADAVRLPAIALFLPGFARNAAT